jgi:hypothetical protein
MVTQCCVCKKYRTGSIWGRLADAVALRQGISHGYCPSCAEKAFAEIRQINRIKLKALAKATVSSF